MELKNVLKSVVVAGSMASALMMLQGCCHEREVYDYEMPAPSGHCDRCATKCNTCHVMEKAPCDTGCAPKRSCGTKACADNSDGWYSN